MKHYRILEKKDDRKIYIIEYLNPLFFGLSYWKKLNNTEYNKYDEALSEVKAIIKQEDYETTTIGYHYIDAYKLIKSKTTNQKPTPPSSQIIKDGKNSKPKK